MSRGYRRSAAPAKPVKVPEVVKVIKRTVSSPGKAAVMLAKKMSGKK